MSTEDLDFEAVWQENIIGTEYDVDSVNFLNLYNQLINAEDSNQKAVHAVIRAYYNFGQDLKKRLEYHTKSHKKQVAQIMRLGVSSPKR